MTPFDTRSLAELIHRKRQCLLSLHTVGQKQLELVRGGTMTELLDLLAAKQQVLLQLQGVERDLDPFRAQDPDSRTWPSPESRGACAAELAECEALLADIVRQERASEQELIRRRDAAGAQLAGAQAAGRAQRAYLDHATDPPAHLDLVSEQR